MHLRRSCLAVILLFLYLLAGCTSVETVPIENDYDYFPLETGRFIIYTVDEVLYTLNALPVRRTYQLKETIGTVYADVTGQPAYKLLRYRRVTEKQPWQLDSVWSARLVNSDAIRTENGADFVKLVFPIRDQLAWDGNQLNSLGNDRYDLRNSRQPFRVSDKEYSETVTILAQNDSTLVSQDRRLDVYARKIGLIYKERIQLQFCSSTPACLGTYQIDYGIRQIYRIQSTGYE